MIFFDLVGTLIEPRGTIGSQYAALAARFGITADAGALDRAFRAATRRVPTFAMPDAADPDLDARERRVWLTIVRRVFEHAGMEGEVSSARFAAYFDALFEHFAGGDAWRPFPDTLPALDRLHRAGVRLALVTNFDRRVFRLLERLDLARWFDSVTIPASARAAKPDPAILRRALEHHGLQATDAVYIGDSMAEDVAAALAAGIAPVLIDRAGGHGPLPPEVRLIGSLLELIDTAE